MLVRMTPRHLTSNIIVSEPSPMRKEIEENKITKNNTDSFQKQNFQAH